MPETRPAPVGHVGEVARFPFRASNRAKIASSGVAPGSASSHPYAAHTARSSAACRLASHAGRALYSAVNVRTPSAPPTRSSHFCSVGGTPLGRNRRRAGPQGRDRIYEADDRRTPRCHSEARSKLRCSAGLPQEQKESDLTDTWRYCQTGMAAAANAQTANRAATGVDFPLPKV